MDPAITAITGKPSATPVVQNRVRQMQGAMFPGAITPTIWKQNTTSTIDPQSKTKPYTIGKLPQTAATKPAPTDNLWKREQEKKWRKFFADVPGGGINGSNIRMDLRKQGLDI